MYEEAYNNKKLKQDI